MKQRHWWLVGAIASVFSLTLFQNCQKNFNANQAGVSELSSESTTVEDGEVNMFGKAEINAAGLFQNATQQLLAQQKYDGLKYFGFYASAMEGAPNSGWTGDYTNELKDFTNVSWVQGGNIPQKLQNARDNNLKAVFVVIDYFNPNGNFTLPKVGSPEEATMLANWRNAASMIRPYQDTIVSLYIADEPFNKRMPKGDVERIAKYVKAEFPNHPTMVVITYKDVMGDFSGIGIIPKANTWNFGFVDWLAYDCYSLKKSNCDHDKIYSEFRQRLRPEQRSFFVPTATKQGTDAEMIAHAQAMYNRCNNDSKCVGVFPFLWQSYVDPGAGSLIGMRDIPGVIPTWIDIGQRISKKGQYDETGIHPSQSAKVPVYRFFHRRTGEHFLTLSVQEGVNAGYGQPEGIAFHVFAVRVTNSTPLYRCLGSGKHFASTDAKCEGHKNEGAYGYIFKDGSQGGNPIYRMRYAGNGDRMTTQTYNEGYPTYRADIVGPQGYVPY